MNRSFDICVWQRIVRLKSQLERNFIKRTFSRPSEQDKHGFDWDKSNVFSDNGHNQEPLKHDMKN